MRQGATLRALRRERTRRKLVEAAQRVFAASGYERATVDDVAAAAGYSKGAYYFHFSTKEEILLELLRKWAEERRARLQSIRALEQPTAAALMEMVEGSLSYEHSDPEWPVLLLEFWSQALRSEDVRRSLYKAYDACKKPLTEAFERARREGVIASDVDPAAAAALVLAAHDGLAVRSCLNLPWASKVSARRLVAALLSPLMAEREEIVSSDRRWPLAPSRLPKTAV